MAHEPEHRRFYVHGHDEDPRDADMVWRTHEYEHKKTLERIRLYHALKAERDQLVRQLACYRQDHDRLLRRDRHWQRTGDLFLAVSVGFGVMSVVSIATGPRAPVAVPLLVLLVAIWIMAWRSNHPHRPKKDA